MRLKDAPTRTLHAWGAYRIVDKEGFGLRLEYRDGEGWQSGRGTGEKELLREVARLAGRAGDYPRAIAGLAREPLVFCDRTEDCSGHLGPRASKLFSEGLRKYEGLE